MAIPMLNAVEFNRIPSLQFVVPVVSSDPTAYEAGLIYNSVEKMLKFHNGTSWVSLGTGTPSGPAGGDLAGTYPNPAIKADVIVDADVNTAAAIAQSKIANLTTDLAAKALGATVFTAGNGLTGGGSLAAARTFDVGAGSGITVAADAISVDTAWGDARYQIKSEEGAANGYCPLDASSLVPTAHLPPLAITDVFTAANEAAMLALTAQVGDICIRTDVNKTFILSASPASTLANWKEMMAAGQVVSVNGKTGVVTITLAELGGVATTRQVIAGNGLTGGGDLSADRTINFVGDANLSVAADAVSVLSAPKWTTARSITLTGDVTGTAASVDGSANVSIATTFVPPVGVAKHWAGDIPITPSATAPLITHNLNTRDVTVEVYRNSTPWDSVLCDVERTSVNTITLKFATAVTAGQYRAVVTGR